jgi:hypothetical protein
VRQTRHRGSTIAEISFHPNLAHLSQSILTGSNLAIEGDRFSSIRDHLPILTVVALLALLDPEGWQSGRLHRS